MWQDVRGLPQSLPAHARPILHIRPQRSSTWSENHHYNLVCVRLQHLLVYGIWHPHGDEYYDGCLVIHDATQSGGLVWTFWRKVMPSPSSLQGADSSKTLTNIYKTTQCCSKEQHSIIWYIYRVLILSRTVGLCTAALWHRKPSCIDIPQLLLCCSRT